MREKISEESSLMSWHLEFGMIPRLPNGWVHQADKNLAPELRKKFECETRQTNLQLSLES